VTALSEISVSMPCCPCLPRLMIRVVPGSCCCSCPATRPVFRKAETALQLPVTPDPPSTCSLPSPAATGSSSPCPKDLLWVIWCNSTEMPQLT
jgi:hypothetical protein